MFPMIADDELAELAELAVDIKANGQREPIVVAEVDDEIVVADGRNRRAACGTPTASRRCWRALPGL